MSLFDSAALEKPTAGGQAPTSVAVDDWLWSVGMKAMADEKDEPLFQLPTLGIPRSRLCMPESSCIVWMICIVC